MFMISLSIILNCQWKGTNNNWGGISIMARAKKAEKPAVENNKKIVDKYFECHY